MYKTLNYYNLFLYLKDKNAKVKYFYNHKRLDNFIGNAINDIYFIVLFLKISIIHLRKCILHGRQNNYLLNIRILV